MKTINVRQVFTGVWSKELRKYKDRVTDLKDQGSSFMCDSKTGMGKTLNQEKRNLIKKESGKRIETVSFETMYAWYQKSCGFQVDINITLLVSATIRKNKQN